MARVSKKVSAAQREAENAQHRIWKTAIYARLSDFDDVLRNTESLEVQISYIKEYINHRDDLMLLDVFADKRCTGMNFDRPEFRQTKAEKEKELAVVQEELQQKKQIAGNTEVLLTADNLQQYVKKIEVDHKKNTYTEFVF